MANPQINSSQAIVDDRDPRIVFTGDWSLAGVSQEYNTSEHGTRSKGAMAQFSFNGTSVAVYGTVAITDINFGPPVTAFVLDNNSAVTFTAPTTNSTEFQTQYYQSGLIGDGEHKLTLTNVSPNPSIFWIDYMLYSPSSSTPSSASGSSKTNANVGAIVGGVVGATVLVIATVLFYVLYYRRRRRGIFYEYRSVDPKDLIEPELSDSPQTGHPPTIVPFNVIPLEARMSHESSSVADPPVNSGNSLVSSQAIVASDLHSHESSPRLPLPATIPDNNSQNRQPFRKGARPLPAPAPAPPAPRLHEDGGVRLQGGPTTDPENLADIPPAYRQY